jgi:hypothetical protein
LKALKEGRLRLAAGKGGGIPIPIPGSGAGKGTAAMNDKQGKINQSVNGTPKSLLAGSGGTKGMDSRAAKEWLKAAAKATPPPKYQPNSRVTGQRQTSPTEMQQNFKGDPSGQVVTGTPLYQQYLSNRRSMESAVNKEQIPAQYQKQVKEYFESIRAGK